MVDLTGMAFADLVLFSLTALWLVAASFTDLKKREVPDWLSFSLIAIALSIKASESIIVWSWKPIIVSIIGLSVFFILANILYYGKVFAGGDAKLLSAMGAVIPSVNFLSNVLIAGSIYGILYSVFLSLKNRKAFAKEIKKQDKNNFKYASIGFLAVLTSAYFLNSALLYLLSLMLLLLYAVHIFTQAVEKAALIKSVEAKDLTEGDWLFKDVKFKGKIIRADFEGLSKKDLALLRRSGKKIYVKYGIPFVPVFLIAFILTVFFGDIIYFIIKLYGF